MSADNDLPGDLEGLLGGLPPAKKAAAKKAPAKKAEAKPEPEPQETPETFQGQKQNTVSEDGPELVTTPAERPQWTPEALQALRDKIRDEVLAEVREQKAQQAGQHQEAMARAIEATHKGSQEPGGDTGNPFTLPKVPEGTQLPSLIHFTGDGFTVNGKVTYRGQEYVPTEYDTWATMTPQEQILQYKEVKFRIGPWEGLPFDLSDPNLTEEDRIKLEAVMRDRYAQRVTAPLA